MYFGYCANQYVCWGLLLLRMSVVDFEIGVCGGEREIPFGLGEDLL